MNKIAITIVIPTYNRACELKRCLESLIQQTYKNFEILICDDGSTDNTESVVLDYKNQLDIRYFWLKNFGGPARARNKGIAEARGEYIAFLDSDDWWHPKKLEYSIDYLNQGADLVYHDLWLVSDSHQKVFWKRARTRKLSIPVFRDLLFNGNAINNSSVVVRLDVVRKVGLLKESNEYIAWEDFEYWLRIANITENFKRIPKCLGFYWIGGNNLSNDKRALDNLEMIKLKYKIEYEFYYSKHDVYPNWLTYAILVRKLNLSNLPIIDLIFNLKLLNYNQKIKILVKWFLKLLSMPLKT